MALEPEAGPMATDTYTQTETEKKETGQQTHAQIQSGLQLLESNRIYIYKKKNKYI